VRTASRLQGCTVYNNAQRMVDPQCCTAAIAPTKTGIRSSLCSPNMPSEYMDDVDKTNRPAHTHMSSQCRARIDPDTSRPGNSRPGASGTLACASHPYDFSLLQVHEATDLRTSHSSPLSHPCPFSPLYPRPLPFIHFRISLLCLVTPASSALLFVRLRSSHVRH
jgi:hypothetical protein